MRDNTKLLLLVLLSLIFAGLFIGIGLNLDNYQYFLSRRVPKVLAIVLAGIAIAQSSLAFQTITHNRILTPSIMGFDSLYMFVQVMVVVLFGGLSSYALNPYVNFSLSVAVMLAFSSLLFAFYFRRQQSNLMALLLLGVILGQLFSNISSFFIMLMDPNDFSSVQANMFASFNNVKVELVYWVTPLLLLVCFGLFQMHRLLDVFWLDNDNAVSLGVDVRLVTRNVLMLSAILIAISTALVGPVMFFGLLVTNLTREWFRSYQHKTLLIGCSAISVCALLSGQWVVEKVFQFETTLSVVINFIGGIYFLSLLLRNKVV
ncbi:iron chelate uptake ABC transporter permease subunit VctG [Vibrio aestuarianus]|uniref:Iron chelate uptake ABC transporter permease subunit VctG n=1 Tax=Vibrio aestuarianus TaxID=28171 RepID=A0A9X4FHD3_9VIBR|nr:iron chelate uptake ABC transporter permease subunit VctG [Vibrio aestuarianus]MDE1229488.1 iron chelate uptake ABC transporter permease subunit VctG [Vibrio aestuarianus]MDE1234497.1 iron chelate uptake ABC transporter permease subunit VctG [Vibrio aestuarianus]MDE1245267.1 iron chelate uptake ABC transporter permease subunit VctG [Vibrio aestuarianus]MDE1253346.1 iron chelate uptake ABC transporter permease subunit VctG [Vibrio aestuarianus]MDE1258659.1 iron chelate uptake ABC transporter